MGFLQYLLQAIELIKGYTKCGNLALPKLLFKETIYIHFCQTCFKFQSLSQNISSATATCSTIVPFKPFSLPPSHRPPSDGPTIRSHKERHLRENHITWKWRGDGWDGNPSSSPVAWLQRTQGLQTFATAILTVFNLLSGRACFVFRIFWRWKWTQLLLVPWDMEMNMIATVLTNGHAKFHQPWPSHPSKQWMGYSQGPAMMVVGSKKDYLPTHRSDSMQQGAKPKDSFIS